MDNIDFDSLKNVNENTVSDALNTSSFSLFHLKALFASGMGFLHVLMIFLLLELPWFS